MADVSTNELELVERAKKGDQEALTEIVKTYSDRLYTLLMRLLRNSHEAEDVLQETFITMIEKISTYKGKSQLYTWLYRIATNYALMRLRKGQKLKRLSIDERVVSDEVHRGETSAFPSQPDKELHSRETKEALDEAINNLTAPYRAVFVLRDIEQMSVRETARTLKITEDNVKTRLRRARIFLREQLSEKLV